MKKSFFRMFPSVGILLLAMLIFDRTQMLFCTLIAASFHECGHLLAAKCLHIPISRIRLDILGARIDLCRSVISYRDEWLLSAAGPLFSFLLSAVLSPLWRMPFFYRVSIFSYLLGLLNLLPIRSFDGGRMLSAFVSSAFGIRAAGIALKISTAICLFFLFSLGAYLLLFGADGISVFLFSLSLIFRFFGLEKSEDF